jgi:hypothetical protein
MNVTENSKTDNVRGRRTSRGVDCRRWLRSNGYEVVADLIDEVVAEWTSAGKKTRRDWWAVLAGTTEGKACVIAGRTFPIVKAARDRQGLAPVPNALELTPGVSAPPIQRTGRWFPKVVPVAAE